MLARKPLRRLSPKRRQGKFGVSDPVNRIYNGVLYDSKKEAGHAALLDACRGSVVPAYQVVDVKRQVHIPMVVNGHLICKYIVDFVVTYGDGRVQYEEVKGFETKIWKIKEKLFRAIYPDRHLKVIK